MTRDAGVTRWYRPAMVALSAVFLAMLALDLATVVVRFDEARPALAADFLLYRDAGARWLSGGGFYGAFQLAGPYVAWGNPSILYPPTTLLLFAPFTVLPAVLWWAIPVGVTTAVVAWHRPRPLAWPVLAMCLWFPTTGEVIWAGNPVLWVVAALALGTRWPAASVLVALKPTLGPFALWGIRHRSWWIGAAILALISIPFAGMWIDYIRAVLNARDPNGLFYSLNQVPTLLIPVVAWLGSSHRVAVGVRGRPQDTTSMKSAVKVTALP